MENVNKFLLNTVEWAVRLGIAALLAYTWNLQMWRNSLDRDLDLIKCKLGVEENSSCPWTTTIVEDLQKAEGEENGVQ